MQINFSEIEKKRQERRTSEQVYKTTEDYSKEKFYVLDMFPYPSGAALHVGHLKGYVASDILTRKKKLEGFNVLHPMGFDTFGLGTEQYAIDHQMKPQDVSAKNIEIFKTQLKALGFSYDWSRSFSTADPEYFRWTQWIFLQMYKRGLAYIDYKPINWCPHCKTGLANEDLDDGKCERCSSEVEQKPMKQRVLKISEYADRLISGLDKLDRDESMKELERNWIGMSSGTQFKMKVLNLPLEFEVFTTRIDTVFGMTFVVMAPEHSLVDQITIDEYRDAVNSYKEQARHKTQLERTEFQKEKTGQFTGAYAINPFNNREVPIYIGDYVLANYGTGVVMAVPAHDQRDFDFARKYAIPIIQSVNSGGKYEFDKLDELPEIATFKGFLVNSGEFDNLKSEDAISAMQQWLKEKKIGGEKSNCRLQDWVFSRQRYRGEPFPIVFCPEHGIVPMDKSDLPLLLPEVENYQPTGTEEGPLAGVESWINTTCPICGKPAKRESNTMPGRAGSSRYRLRYMSPKDTEYLVNPEAEKYRGNVDVYVGGAEHVTRHMIYARFWQKFLFDIGVVNQEEPFQRYEKVGLIMAEDGRKMSKRRGNVINPDDIIAEYGADALRTYEMFMGPFDQFINRNTNGLKGVKKFFDKVIALWDKISDDALLPADAETLLHQTIKKTTEDIDAFRFNTCVSRFMILVNRLFELDSIPREVFQIFITLLAPFAPHLAEEFWEKLGNQFSIFQNAQRPQRSEEKLTSNLVKLAVQFNGKVRGTIEILATATQEEALLTIKNDEKLNNYLNAGDVGKVIYVPGKIINIVVV